MNPRAILSCTSSRFSTICLRTYVPSAVHLPFLNPCCTSRSHILLFSWSLRLKQTLYNSSRTWLSSVMPLAVQSWVMHIPFPLPYRHYQGHHPLLRYPSLLHTHVQRLPVHLTPTSPAVSNVSSHTSSAPVALPFHLVPCCFHFFMSYLLHLHLSPNRAREIEVIAAPFLFSSNL